MIDSAHGEKSKAVDVGAAASRGDLRQGVLGRGAASRPDRWPRRGTRRRWPRRCRSFPRLEARVRLGLGVRRRKDADPGPCVRRQAFAAGARFSQGSCPARPAWTSEPGRVRMKFKSSTTICAAGCASKCYRHAAGAMAQSENLQASLRRILGGEPQVAADRPAGADRRRRAARWRYRLRWLGRPATASGPRADDQQERP